MIELTPLEQDDRNQFVLDNQYAFKYGAMEEFGMRDNHFEEDGEIISRKTIEESIDRGQAYRIVEDGRKVGGLVVRVNGEHGELDLLFTDPNVHSRGIGYAAWCEVEKMFPNVKVWETCTPYFETRNIHFYINKCGFHAVEFFNSKHPEPDYESDAYDRDHEEDGPDGMFRFEKKM